MINALETELSLLCHLKQYNLQKKEMRTKNQNHKQRGKKHTGKFDTIAWDEEALKAAAESYINDDKDINRRELARKHHVTTKNGGQIIKEYLKSEGFDVNLFKKKSPDRTGTAPRVRRKKKENYRRRGASPYRTYCC